MARFAFSTTLLFASAVLGETIPAGFVKVVIPDTSDNFINLVNPSLTAECHDSIVKYGVPVAKICLKSDHINIAKTDGFCTTSCKNALAEFHNNAVPACGNQVIFPHVPGETAADFASHAYFTSAVGCVYFSVDDKGNEVSVTKRDDSVQKRAVGPSVTDNLSCLLVQTGNVLNVAGQLDFSSNNNAVITTTNVVAQVDSTACSTCVDNQVQALTNLPAGVLSEADLKAANDLNDFFDALCQPLGAAVDDIFSGKEEAPRVVGSVLGLVGTSAQGIAPLTGNLRASGANANTVAGAVVGAVAVGLMM